MHIYFSGIGGTGIGPLAEIAFQAGYTVSGSDKQDSQYIHYLKQVGITDVHIGQGAKAIAAIHDANPIDWFVYTSALPLENPNAPELEFCKQQNIKTSKRDELLNQIIRDKKLKLIAIAGTQGKTTTTAMTVWLLKQLDVPLSYALPAKVSFGDMGEFDPGSQYFVYEADEFDRNFLNFEPFISVITGVSWDHHEIFPTRDEYQQAFRDFIAQSQTAILWHDDGSYLGLNGITDTRLLRQDAADGHIDKISLKGLYNRLDAWLAIMAVQQVSQASLDDLIEIVNRFPGLNRRMEELIPNLYSDYAHTPEKVRGAMSAAGEMAADAGQQVVVIYEPLTDRRQHYMIDDYKDCFSGASKVYWLPSYLAREDPTQQVLEPAELIAHLSDPSIAEPAAMNDDLKHLIKAHLGKGDMVVGMAGGGGHSLDEWLRAEFTA